MDFHGLLEALATTLYPTFVGLKGVKPVDEAFQAARTFFSRCAIRQARRKPSCPDDII